ncbi:MAG: hypothetical protein NTY93_02140 [Candidatus Kaiserbacteria bacterium]|nr:hypothetical protein [Candidatus Kaiserbacteria bacterium]
MSVIATFFAIVCLWGATGNIIFVANSPKNAADQSILKLNKPILPISTFPDGAIAAGKTLGFEVSSVNRNTNEIGLSKKTSLILRSATGKQVSTSVQLALQSDEQTINITVTTEGNFGNATQENVAKIIDDFKKELSRQFPGG